MDSKQIREQMRVAYDKDAQRRGKERSRSDVKQAVRADFAKLLLAEGKTDVLELGAGSGQDSEYFTEQGFSVLATDISPGMVAACKAKGLRAQVADLYELDSLQEQFDAVFAMNVLLHVPKNDLATVLQQIAGRLRTGGIFGCSVHGGTSKESIYEDPIQDIPPRYFAFYTDDELKSRMQEHFDSIRFAAYDTGESDLGLHLQTFLLRKR